MKASVRLAAVTALMCLVISHPAHSRGFGGRSGGGRLGGGGLRGGGLGSRGIAGGGFREGGRSLGGGALGREGLGDRGLRADPIGGRGISAGGDRALRGVDSRIGEAAGSNRMATDFGLSHHSVVGAARVDHGTQLWSNNYLYVHGNSVRASFNHYDFFGASWYGAHPGAWSAAGWTGGTVWRAASWRTLGPWWGIRAAPIYYDYGNTVVYRGPIVYVNGTNAGTTSGYAQQAIKLAGEGRGAMPPALSQWQPLGVFALIEGDETTSNRVFQLAANESGIIRGNYHDAATGEATPVAGSVDSGAQRAAWTIGNNPGRVFDTGIYNLTQNQTPVLVHGTDGTQQFLLVRLQQQRQSGQ